MKCINCGGPALPLKDHPPVCIACFAELHGVPLPSGNNREVVKP